jgi:hypothetical protein
MSPSRKSDQPRRPRGSHATRRHGAARAAAAQPPQPPPLAEWSRLGAELALPPVGRIGAIAWLARVALRDEERAA